MKSPLAELNMRYFNSANGYSNKKIESVRPNYIWIRDRRLLSLKMRGCILSGRYFLHALVYGDQAEEKSAFRADFLPLV
ncbi:Uncharacterised protein [Bacteroides heparinolyticus]|uniref:Uncharacterized protein n=1 Tax=Prevotella heparinolytica TaxID=28113 RepID=A0A449I0U7_9BACE|nr:Uncharacterised protein [Bacteroides heparinolyticus]